MTASTGPPLIGGGESDTFADVLVLVALQRVRR